MKYTFLPEASSKMLYRHIKEVEYCAAEIFKNNYKRFHNKKECIVSICKLDTEISNEVEFVFFMHVIDHKNNRINYHVRIPVEAFDTCNEHWKGFMEITSFEYTY